MDQIHAAPVELLAAYACIAADVVLVFAILGVYEHSPHDSFSLVHLRMFYASLALLIARYISKVVIAYTMSTERPGSNMWSLILLEPANRTQNPDPVLYHLVEADNMPQGNPTQSADSPILSACRIADTIISTPQALMAVIVLFTTSIPPSTTSIGHDVALATSLLLGIFGIVISSTHVALRTGVSWMYIMRQPTSPTGNLASPFPCNSPPLTTLLFGSGKDSLWPALIYLAINTLTQLACMAIIWTIAMIVISLASGNFYFGDDDLDPYDQSLLDLASPLVLVPLILLKYALEYVICRAAGCGRSSLWQAAMSVWIAFPHKGVADPVGSIRPHAATATALALSMLPCLFFSVCFMLNVDMGHKLNYLVIMAITLGVLCLNVLPFVVIRRRVLRLQQAGEEAAEEAAGSELHDSVTVAV